MKKVYQKPSIILIPITLQHAVASGSNQAVSDRRLKRDIKPLAELNEGTKLYGFKYLWSETDYVGVMAQDLLNDPQRAKAVSKQPNGFYVVDYQQLGLQMVTLETWVDAGIDAVLLTGAQEGRFASAAA